MSYCFRPFGAFNCGDCVFLGLTPQAKCFRHFVATLRNIKTCVSGSYSLVGVHSLALRARIVGGAGCRYIARLTLRSAGEADGLRLLPRAPPSSRETESMTRRYFCPDLPRDGGLVSLSSEEAGHASRVMRAKIGDSITLFDGVGHEADATIESLGRSECVCVAGKAITELTRMPSR